MKYSRLDLQLFNSFLSFPYFSHINKQKFSHKILRQIKLLNFKQSKNIDRITEKYVDHINSDLFTPLGRRLHSILASKSLSEGIKFHKSINTKVESLKPPIFVIGLPRSGTTNLHNLIINNFDTHGLRYWELSSPANLSSNKYIDEKFRKLKSNFGFYLYRYLVPSIQSMHKVDMNTYEECWHFQKNFFLCYNFVIQIKFLELEDYLISYGTQDILNIYKKYLFSKHEDKQTALKCPDHLMFLPDILKVFPDAKIIWVHRNPKDSISSYCPMIESVWNLFFGGDNKKNVLPFIVDLYERMLKKAISDRKKMKSNIIDVSFNDLINERESLVKSLSSKLNLPIISKNVNKKRPSFFKNKFKFNPEDYGILNYDIHEKFDFYLKQYSNYL